MRRIVLIALLGLMCTSLSGCWFFDAAHNRKKYEYMKHDMKLIHEDLDFILLLDRKSPNEAYYR